MNAILKKAIIIDDALARPTPADLQQSITGLRSFLTDNPETKAWFDTEFGLSGSHTQRNYFKPLLEDPQKVKKLWEKRYSSPSSEQLSQQALVDLEAELAPHHQPLIEIERVLIQKGWELKKFSELPSVEEIDTDVSIVIIDYLLSLEVPEDTVAKVAESTEFISKLVLRAKDNQSVKYPYIILISSLQAAAADASEFRSSVNTPGGLFRFIKKLSISSDFLNVINAFIVQEEELHKFREVHQALCEGIALATQELHKYMDNLELEDLATLHAGQLVTEKEPLSDYFGWLCGQVVIASVQKNIPLAEKTLALPNENYQVLLGHLSPTQSLPRLFSSFSVVRTAAGEAHKARTRSREIRFGDLFVRKQKKTNDQAAVAEEPTYFLVSSQTCDLIHNKIANGHVLCVEGKGIEVGDNEVELLLATTQQMAEKGNIIETNNKKFLQIKWNSKNLITILKHELVKEKGFEYLGRLNEIYALEAQHNAIAEIARIGVPIIPGYRMCFSKVYLKVFNGKSEVLAFSLDQNTILAILRSEKKKQRLLLAFHLQKWLVSSLTEIKTHQSLPNGLGKTVDDILNWFTSTVDFSFTVKVNENSADISREVTTVDANGVEKITTTAVNGNVEVLLDGFNKLPAKTNSRIQITFGST